MRFLEVCLGFLYAVASQGFTSGIASVRLAGKVFDRDCSGTMVLLVGSVRDVLLGGALTPRWKGFLTILQEILSSASWSACVFGFSVSFSV
jgi:hypothetical protein